MSVMQWGKYKGWALEQVPKEYLLWLVNESQKRIDKIGKELMRREFAEEANASWERRLIEAGYRTLASKHHPDHGGTDEDMRQVNAAIEHLRGVVPHDKRPSGTRTPR